VVADLAPFPDVEALLIALVADLLPAGTVFPPDLQEQLPYGRILRRPGGGDDQITDSARVDVEIAAATRAQARELAAAVQQRLISGPAAVPGHGVMDRAVTESGPHRVLHEDPAVRCVQATYTVSLRRRA
jgi:hypothetical protein